MSQPAPACRVLVVEDDPASREALLRLLAAQGHDARPAENLRQGLDQLDWPPEAIVLDLVLPDGLGIAILRHVRTRGLRIRIALLTGVDRPQELGELVEYEPDAIFTKPLDFAALARWIELEACKR